MSRIVNSLIVENVHTIDQKYEESSRSKTISTLNINCQNFKRRDLERQYNETGHPIPPQPKFFKLITCGFPLFISSEFQKEGPGETL